MNLEKITILNKTINLKSEYAKEEIEIRIESLKMQLDELQDQLMSELNDNIHEFQE
jgi:hypothetical protein